MSIHRRFSENFWKVPENFGVFQRILTSAKEFQRVSSSIWRFLEVLEIVGDFWEFPRDSQSFPRLSRSFKEFWGVLEIFQEFPRVFGKS